MVGLGPANSRSEGDSLIAGIPGRPESRPSRPREVSDNPPAPGSQNPLLQPHATTSATMFPCAQGQAPRSRMRAVAQDGVACGGQLGVLKNPDHEGFGRRTQCAPGCHCTSPRHSHDVGDWVRRSLELQMSARPLRRRGSTANNPAATQARSTVKMNGRSLPATEGRIRNGPANVLMEACSSTGRSRLCPVFS